jgi:putative ABC transport system permease protein
MLSSLLHGWRSWKSARGVGWLAVAALAIGIGSTTAIYSVVQAVLLNPLPYANPDRYFLMLGYWRPRPGAWTINSYPDALDYAAQAQSFDAFGCDSTSNFNLTFNHEPVRVRGTQVTGTLMRSTGISPVMGRWFDDADENSGAARGVVLSASLWKRFGSDPNILGKPLVINGEPYVVSGVMPGWFHYPIYAPESYLWLPLNPDEHERKSRNSHYLRCVAKLKPGVTQEQATQEVNRILGGLQREYPGEAEPDFNRLTPLVPFAVQGIRPSLILLLGSAIALLLITCANVASVLLARSVARARETAVRVALGATGWQLGLQYFSEGVLVSLAGAAAGTLLSLALVRTVLSIAADEIPRADQIAFNWKVLLFALSVAVGCGIFFSFWPLWQARRTAPNEVLTEGARASGGRGSRNLLKVFVVAEVALAFGLLAVGGLISEQLRGLRRIHAGFEPTHLSVVNMTARETRYKNDAARIAHETQLRDGLRHVPGVESAGFIDLMPLVDWGWNTLIEVEGRPNKDLAHSESVETREVSPDYFQTMKIPLLEGRFFNESDKQAAVMPMLINETLARLYWPHGDPVGAFVHLFGWEDARFQVVGVVGDVHNADLASPPLPEFYLSYRELPPENMAWAVRSPLDMATLTRELRAAVQRVDPEQPISDVRSMEEILERSVSRQRLQSLVVTFFAVSALLLAILGVYGVVAYAVRQRITEMGTRMAVGAAPRDVLRLVLGDGLKMAWMGVGIGLVVMLALARLLGTSDLRLRITSAWPFVIASVLIAGCTIVASWWPAWRATNLSPMVAIRSDIHTTRQRGGLTYRVLTERISEIVTQGPEPAEERVDLLAAISEASRHAESFSQVLALALERVRERMNAAAVYLFVSPTADQPFRMKWTAADSAPEQNFLLPANGLVVGRLRNYSSALPLSREELRSVRRWAEEHAPVHVTEIQVLEALEIRVAVPLLSESGITGLLLLGPAIGRTEYVTAERRALRAAAAQLALMIENGRLTERIVEQERLRRELMLAAEVQRRLLPERSPETRSIRLAGICMPARGVGGDYYDFLDLGNRQVGIALADVAGKGIAAALLMSVIQASLRSLAESDGASLAELTSKLNRLLHRSTAANSYATFFYAQVDDGEKRLRYVNAGHNPPFLLRNGRHSEAASEDHIEELAQGGMIIGMFAQSHYQEAEVQLESGDVLIIYSDGVTEAHSPGDEEFGDDRLKSVLRRSAHLPIDEMADCILRELKAWMADAAQYDDLTFVLMKVV